MTKAFTKESFLARCRSLHNEFYNYQNSVFKGYSEIFTYDCPIHGRVNQKASYHLAGNGCQKCGRESTTNNQRKDTDYYVRRSRLIHGDRYSYELSNYVHSTIPVLISCRDHGSFPQRMNDHIRGNGCPKCSNELKKSQKRLKLTAATFKEKAIDKNGELYTYDKAAYKDKRTRVVITCKIHGDFKCLPAEHLEGRGCPFCAGFVSFMEKGRELYGNKFEYHMETYKNRNTKTSITCIEHGDFEQIASEHLRKGSKLHCPICRQKNRKIDFDEFVARSKECHGDSYVYDRTVIGETSLDFVEIYCKTCKEYFHQKAVYHLQGFGCSKCCQSKGERRIRIFLKKIRIAFDEQKKFPGLVNVLCLRCDFYIDKYKLVIEFDGGQHFFPVERFGGLEEYEKTKKRDQIKNRYCEEHGLNLLRVKDGQVIDEEISAIIFMIEATMAIKQHTFYHHLHGLKKTFIAKIEEVVL